MQGSVQEYIFVFVFSGAVATACTYATIQLAKRFHLTSQHDFRRKRKRSVPLLGGIGIYISLCFSALFFKFDHAFAYLLPALPLVVMGVIDDIKELGAKVKLVMQLASVGLFLAFIPSDLIFTLHVGWPLWMGYGLTGFWLLGIINAFNMIDGIDTLASGISVIVCGFLAYFLLDSNFALIPFGVMGACLGFLVFNKPPAKVYLGDCGSTLLGYFCATLSLFIVGSGSAQFIHLLIPLFLLAHPEVDAVLAIIRRYRAGSSLMKGDHDHIHHKLLKLGLGLKRSILTIFGATLYCGLTTIALFYAENLVTQSLIAVLSVGGLVTLLTCIYVMEYRHAMQISSFSKTLIAQHIDVEPNVDITKDDFYAVVYDLLPYYKELQLKGILVVQEFIKSFGGFIQEHHPGAQLLLLGSYTIVTIETGKEDKKPNLNLAEAYFKFLSQHKVQKNDNGLPWGMSFYSDDYHGKQFLHKFCSGQTQQNVIQLKKTG